MNFGIIVFGILVTVEVLRFLPDTSSYLKRLLFASLVLIPFYIAGNYISSSKLELALPIGLAVALGALIAMLSYWKALKNA